MNHSLKIILIFFSLSTFLYSCQQKNKNEIEIGASMLSLQSEFVVNVKDAMQQKAKEEKVSLRVTDAERTAYKQLQQVETFISQKVNAIILNPCEVQASSPAIDRAKAAGIPIVNVNSETESKPDAFVGSDDENAGEMAMEYIAKQINFEGDILIMEGFMGQAAQIKRTSGARKVLEKYPKINVLAVQTADWDRAKGLTLMENWIQNYGTKIKAVFAENDEMGLGALQALEQAKIKDQVVLVGIDAIADALKAVKDNRLNATIFQDAKAQGATAIEMAIKLAKKEKLDTTEVLIPFKLVTKENVQEFMEK